MVKEAVAVVVVVVGSDGGGGTLAKAALLKRAKTGRTLLKTAKPGRVSLHWTSLRFKTLRFGNLVVVASCGMERRSLSERLRVWRLGNWCGALNSGLRFLMLVLLRSKETRCLKMGLDKISIEFGEVPIGALERFRWARAGEKGIWIKLPNFGLIPK